MGLGAFSVSLAVKDLAASRAFDQKFGFAAFARAGFSRRPGTSLARRQS